MRIITTFAAGALLAVSAVGTGVARADPEHQQV
jgi:hypothetical protein